jgi:hypothetical protein
LDKKKENLYILGPVKREEGRVGNGSIPISSLGRGENSQGRGKFTRERKSYRGEGKIYMEREFPLFTLTSWEWIYSQLVTG